MTTQESGPSVLLFFKKKNSFDVIHTDYRVRGLFFGNWSDFRRRETFARARLCGLGECKFDPKFVVETNPGHHTRRGRRYKGNLGSGQKKKIEAKLDAHHCCRLRVLRGESKFMMDMRLRYSLFLYHRAVVDIISRIFSDTLGVSLRASFFLKFLEIEVVLVFKCQNTQVRVPDLLVHHSIFGELLVHPRILAVVQRHLHHRFRCATWSAL